jgi:hypothetical protein
MSLMSMATLRFFGCFDVRWTMPRPRRDGTPARLPNKRKLTDSFVRTVRPDPDRSVMYWDTLQRGDHSRRVGTLATMIVFPVLAQSKRAEG